MLVQICAPRAILISLPVPGVITIWVICFPFCFDAYCFARAEEYSQTFRLPRSSGQYHKTAVFRHDSIRRVRFLRACCHRCEVKQGRICHLSRIGISLGAYGRRRGQRTRIRFGIGRIGNYRNIQGLEVTIRLYNRQLQTGKMIDLLDISAQSEGCGTEKKYRLADYFNRWWDEYAKHPAEYITPEQYKAANAIRVCRTAALGIDTYACPECGEVREIYHSCKNRFCPTCGWRDTLKWAARMKDKLLRVPHRHVVMTLPHVLLDLVKRNKKEMLNIMMRTSAEALKIWMMKAFGLKVGVIAVLHTYGETKQYHVHTHMILSWGGIDGNGRIVVPERSKVNDAFIRSIFKHTFDKALIELFDNGKLKHGFRNRMEFMSFIKHVVNKKQWIVHLEPPLEMPEQVIQYIGRYSKRACLSEYKITAMEDENITFRYRDYQNSPDRRNPLEKELTLHYREFFPRLMQHVPLHYFRIVRYYGFYSNKGNLPGEYFERDENVMQNAPAEESDYENPFFCECCQRARIYVHTIITRRTVFDESPETLVFSRSDIRKQKVA
mgnify:CR=1 FL=1